MEDYFELNPIEVKERFTLMSLNLSGESEKSIIKFLEDNKRIIANPEEEFNSTLHYSVETPVFMRENIVDEIKSYLPIEISPKELALDVFGFNELVLRYENPSVQHIRKLFLHEGVRQVLSWSDEDELNENEFEIAKTYLSQRRGRVYYGFNPHITIAEYFDKKNLEKLSGFD